MKGWYSTKPTLPTSFFVRQRQDNRKKSREDYTRKKSVRWRRRRSGPKGIIRFEIRFLHYGVGQREYSASHDGRQQVEHCRVWFRLTGEHIEKTDQSTLRARETTQAKYSGVLQQRDEPNQCWARLTRRAVVCVY